MFASKEDIETLFGGSAVAKPRKLFIFHCDYACSARCEHCLMNGVDVPKTRIKDDVARKIIDFASRADLAIYPVSGDPFTWYDYFTEFLLPTLDEYRCKRVISTNGSWGCDRRIIDKALKLPIQNLVLTVDRFHQKFVPIKFIDNILDAFKGHSSTKVYVASVWSPTIPANEVKLKYDLPRYELSMLSFTKYWHDNKAEKPKEFFLGEFSGETVECRKNMYFVNDFDGNVYVECAAYLEGFPCKLGNVFTDSPESLIKKKDGPRVKFKITGAFDPTAPHTDACIDCQRAGIMKNFFEDATYEVVRNKGGTRCSRIK